MIYSIQLTYNTIIALVKISIVCFYLRLGKLPFVIVCSRACLLTLHSNGRQCTPERIMGHHSFSDYILHHHSNHNHIAMSADSRKLGSQWECQEEMPLTSDLQLLPWSISSSIYGYFYCQSGHSATSSAAEEIRLFYS